VEESVGSAEGTQRVADRGELAMADSAVSHLGPDAADGLREPG